MDDLVIPREILFFHICPHLDVRTLSRLAESCREFWSRDWRAWLTELDCSKLSYEEFSRFSGLRALKLHAGALELLTHYPNHLFHRCNRLESLELLQPVKSTIVIPYFLGQLFRPLTKLRLLHLDLAPTFRYSFRFLSELPGLEVFKITSTPYYKESTPPGEEVQPFPSVVEFHCTHANYNLVYRFPALKKLVIGIGRDVDIRINTDRLAPLPTTLQTLELHSLILDKITAKWAPSVQTINAIYATLLTPFDGSDWHSLETIKFVGILPGLFNSAPQLRRLFFHCLEPTDVGGKQFDAHLRLLRDIMLPSHFSLRLHPIRNPASTYLVENWISRHSKTLEEVIRPETGLND